MNETTTAKSFSFWDLVQICIICVGLLALIGKQGEIDRLQNQLHLKDVQLQTQQQTINQMGVYNQSVN
jgi:hypothetical protein